MLCKAVEYGLPGKTAAGQAPACAAVARTAFELSLGCETTGRSGTVRSISETGVMPNAGKSADKATICSETRSVAPNFTGTPEPSTSAALPEASQVTVRTTDRSTGVRAAAARTAVAAWAGRY